MCLYYCGTRNAPGCPANNVEPATVAQEHQQRWTGTIRISAAEVERMATKGAEWARFRKELELERRFRRELELERRRAQAEAQEASSLFTSLMVD